MADKASRSLVIYGDGLAKLINPSHTHLHSLASKSLCGFLTLPNASLSETSEERIVREFAHLLDSSQAYCRESSTGDSLYAISERFMGMKAAVVTDNPSLKSFASKLGFTVLSFKDLCRNNSSASQSSIDFATSELLKLLGFQEGKIVETSQFDLVFMHVGDGEGGEPGVDDVEFANTLVGGIMRVAQPCSDVCSRLHLSVVMSYGNISNFDGTHLSVLTSKDEMSPNLAALVPRQSYTMRGEKPRDDVRHQCPMLVAQWQDAVTRVDLVETFIFKDFKERGGNLAIPADRFLHEVAFKLWKAPKYGA